MYSICWVIQQHVPQTNLQLYQCPPLKAIAIYQQRGEGRNQASAFYEHIAQMEVVSLRFTYKTYTQYTALFCPVVELMTATYTYTARNGTGKDTN